LFTIGRVFNRFTTVTRELSVSLRFRAPLPVDGFDSGRQGMGMILQLRELGRIVFKILW
jgi:hypothetical protein